MLAVHSIWDSIANNWALVGIGLTLTVLILVPALIFKKYVNICLKIFDAVPPLAYGPKHHGRLPGELVDFSALDGHALRGVLVPGNPDQPRRGAVIFAHEFLSDRTSCMRYCGALTDAGYEVFAFDFRGHGDSPGERDYAPKQWPSDREHADLLGAVAFVEDHLEKQHRPAAIGILGVSRGASAAILAAADVPHIKAIVADGAFSTDSALEFFMKKWAGIFAKLRFVYENHPPTVWRFLRWRVIRRASRRCGCRFPSALKALRRTTGTAIFFIHGERDSYIPLCQADRLFAAAVEPKYLWIAPKAKHNESAVLHHHRYGESIVRFFNEHLAAIKAPIPPLSRGAQSAYAPSEAESLSAPQSRNSLQPLPHHP